MAGRFWKSAARLVASVMLAAMGAFGGAVATAVPASAQGLVLTCATLGLFSFDPIAAPVVGATRTEQFDAVAGSTITVQWQGLTALFVTVNGIQIPGTLGANGTVTYTVPTTGLVTIFKSVTGGPGFVRFNCLLPNAPPVNPPPLIAAPTTAEVVDTFLGQVHQPRPFRRVEVLKRNKCGDPNANRYDFGDGGGLDDAPEVTTVPPVRNASGVIPDTSFVVRFNEPFDCPDSEEEFPPPFDVDAEVGGTILSNTFGSLPQRTAIGTVDVGFKLNDADFDRVYQFTVHSETAVGTFEAPANTTLNATGVGLDFDVLQYLPNGLYVVGSTGAGFIAGSGTVNGVGVNFNQTSLYAGGLIGGDIAFEEFTFTPHLSATLSLYNRPGFFDANGASVLGNQGFILDLTTGAIISRDIFLPESGVVLTPYAEFTVNLRSTSGNSINALNAALRAGVRARFEDGLAISAYAGAMGGPNIFGLTAGVQMENWW